MNASERYALWCESPLVDEKTKQELKEISSSPAEIEDRFYQELSFGTAGLRGVLGAGDNRMNVYNVRKATEGLARYLEALEGEKKVAVAYDSRHCSELFARETACVLAAHGITVCLYSTLHSVPQLSYTVVKLGCTAGVVITASHNPSKYNGYKVYWSHGGQVGPEQADEILARIREVPDFTAQRADYDEAVKNGTIRLLGAETDELYYADIETLLSDPAYLKAHGSEVSIVYTPLHGTGFVPVTSMMKRIGVTNFFPVPEQSAPDGSFPTVTAPNPEDPAAFTLGTKLAEEKHADLILATDPDADRLGAAVRKKDGSWAVLTGNQIASVLLYSLLTNRKAAGKLPANGLCVRSMVSTRLADAIAKSFGADMKEVLTGFRFISEQISLCETKKEHTFLFGFEESYGYLAGTFSRDKDSIVSAMLLSEAAVRCHSEGKTLYDLLQEIYAKYGFYAEDGKSYTLEGKAGIEKIGEAMKSLRANPPKACGGEEIVDVLDYEDTAATGLPKSNVLKYTLKDGSYFMARPSGTEPKLKLYTGTSAKTKEELDKKNAALLAAAAAVLAERLK